MYPNVFVYGTLKTNQCRATCWPAAPISVRVAWTHGRLYDLGPYPALARGEDRVLGELWHFTPTEMDTVFATLDRIEGTNQPGETNEYNREIVIVHLEDGSQLSASTYFYARLDVLQGLEPQPPSYRHRDQHYVSWPRDTMPAING
jgi:gamma-glutamylcyclotransferase (GGCT)/AIG2-like uncharacterized protein YtfP